MDYIVDQNGFIAETIAIHTEYLGNAVLNESSLTCPMLLEKPKNEDIHMKEAKLKRDYVRYTMQEKVKFFDLKIEKSYRWVSQYNACPVSIFDSGKKVGRKCILTEEHKTTVISFIDANPSATVVEVTEHLLKRFLDLKVSYSTVNSFMKRECNLSLKKVDFHSIERNSAAKIEERYSWVCKWKNTDIDFLANCVFLDKSTFDINMKRSRAWSRKGTRAIVTRPTTRANTTSILGVISAAGLITVGIKKARPAKKRKADGYISSGTVTGHYISFLKMTLDEMGKYPHMKGYYIVMDNALIHTHENIKKYIEYRGYKCVYFPTFS
ncbi:hypothetical protein G6F46_009912 [Rhizopus delemar]|uniref:Tc1-like transposase DDE domain-containing protein n=2 Tax=Rhizopus TaxID=4842 RepID=A0A9P6YYZ7_9FUNG|nr:hypothetical protein G6F55_010151 [Rhizopus delemar]KAG1536540.1 hypothetical protein G6F51_010913 [Rhizopus arrhizus]KAG1496550.1 hypothetical protein G6F54_006393 [Rhizopus delemar]KAG1512123.1 hypothetical protein G6F53_005421 [Rhizopus delemar]KAG1524252.1 hypothetical protein G6F52_004338 [Rhizopus delemar]